MKRKAFIFILMTAIAMLGLVSCQSNRGIDNPKNAKNTVDWDGIYEGTIPSASGSGINVSMEINKDMTFEMSYEYIGKDQDPTLWKGNFKWDDTGNIIILDIKDSVPTYYKVVEHKLIQLDMKGKPIKGKLADDYVLWKVL